MACSQRRLHSVAFLTALTQFDILIGKLHKETDFIRCAGGTGWGWIRKSLPADWKGIQSKLQTGETAWKNNMLVHGHKHKGPCLGEVNQPKKEG